MKPRIIVPFLASLALCASAAMAQDAPSAPPVPRAGHMGHGPWQMNKEDMAKHFQQMCADHYAHAVGTMAYLQTRLALTDTQKPLFERWKNTVLASAKDRSDKCATMKMPDMKPSMVDRLKHREAMLKNRLASLDAQMPSLEALVGSLNEQQQHVLAMTYHQVMAHHMREAMDRHAFMNHRHGHPGPNGDMPPPPPAP
jgi:LTXXQ motif family protein